MEKEIDEQSNHEASQRGEIVDSISGLPLIDNKLDKNFTEDIKLERNGSEESLTNEEEINEKLNEILGIFGNINIQGLEDLRNIRDLNNIDNKDDLEKLNKSFEEISKNINFNELFSMFNKISKENILDEKKLNFKNRNKNNNCEGDNDDNGEEYNDDDNCEEDNDEEPSDDFLTESEDDENENNGIELGENLLDDKFRERMNNLDINEMLKNLGQNSNMNMENMTLGNFGSIFTMMNQIFGGGINKNNEQNNSDEEESTDDELEEYLDKPEREELKQVKSINEINAEEDDNISLD